MSRNRFQNMNLTTIGSLVLKVSGIGYKEWCELQSKEMLRKLLKSFYTFFEDLRDSILFTRHLRCEKQSVIILNQCLEVSKEMFVDKIIKGEIRSFDNSFCLLYFSAFHHKYIHSLLNKCVV